MPLYKNPDFRNLSGGLAAIFASDLRQSFFALPEWYDLMSRVGLLEPSKARVYTDERRGSSAGLLLQASSAEAGGRLTSLANF